MLRLVETNTHVNQQLYILEPIKATTTQIPSQQNNTQNYDYKTSKTLPKLGHHAKIVTVVVAVAWDKIKKQKHHTTTTSTHFQTYFQLDSI